MKPRPLPKISKARKERDKVLRRVEKILWDALKHFSPEGVPLCQWPGCTEPARPRAHHVIERSLRPDLVCHHLNLLFLCWFKHHSKIHNDPQIKKQAYSMGYLGKSTDRLEDLARLREGNK